eukprot:gene20433-24477_t
MDISRYRNLSNPVTTAEGTAAITFLAKNDSDYGDYYLKITPGGLYCPAGYHLQATTSGPVSYDPINITFLYQGDVRSRLLPVNKYDSMCDMEYYIESPEKCTGGADRRAAFINSIKSDTSQHVVVIDSGNAVVGTNFYSVYLGSADADLLMNYAPFDLHVPANFDFNSGESQLSLMMSYLTPATAVVLSNVDWSQTVLARSAIQRYMVKEYDGRQVGFLGFVSEDITDSAPMLSDQFFVNPNTKALSSENIRLSKELSLTAAELLVDFPSCNILVAVGGDDVLCHGVLQYSSNIDVCIARVQRDVEESADAPVEVVSMGFAGSVATMDERTNNSSDDQ